MGVCQARVCVLSAGDSGRFSPPPDLGSHLCKHATLYLISKTPSLQCMRLHTKTGCEGPPNSCHCGQLTLLFSCYLSFGYARAEYWLSAWHIPRSCVLPYAPKVGGLQQSPPGCDDMQMKSSYWWCRRVLCEVYSSGDRDPAVVATGAFFKSQSSDHRLHSW